MMRKQYTWGSRSDSHLLLFDYKYRIYCIDAGNDCIQVATKSSSIVILKEGILHINLSAVEVLSCVVSGASRCWNPCEEIHSDRILLWDVYCVPQVCPPPHLTYLVTGVTYTTIKLRDKPFCLSVYVCWAVLLPHPVLLRPKRWFRFHGIGYEMSREWFSSKSIKYQ